MGRPWTNIDDKRPSHAERGGSEAPGGGEGGGGNALGNVDFKPPTDGAYANNAAKAAEDATDWIIQSLESPDCSDASLRP